MANLLESVLKGQGGGEYKNMAKEKYLIHFGRLDVGKKGYLTGVEARTFMIKSNLPHPVLGKIWDMSDIQKKGSLSKTEFR